VIDGRIAKLFEGNFEQMRKEKMDPYTSCASAGVTLICPALNPYRQTILGNLRWVKRRRT